MGFLPIILTLSGFLTLFVLLLNQYLNQKKKKLMQLQQQVIQGMISSGTIWSDTPDLSPQGQKTFDAAYATWKAQQPLPLSADLAAHVKQPYLQYKLELVRYNKLVVKKPYSMAARLLGHGPLTF